MKILAKFEVYGFDRKQNQSLIWVNVLSLFEYYFKYTVNNYSSIKQLLNTYNSQLAVRSRQYTSINKKENYHNLANGKMR